MIPTDPRNALVLALTVLLAWFPAPIPSIAVAAPAAAPANEPVEEESAADALVQIPDDEAIARGSDTPRNAAFTFIVLARDGDWHDASDMIERPAAGWPDGASPERIARALKGILDHRLWLDFPSLPGASANAPGAPTRVNIGVIDTPETVLEVEMVRVDDRWVFTAGTAEGVPAMARALGLWWVSALPEFLVNIRIAEIDLWQWLGLMAIGGAGLLVGWGFTWLLRHGVLSILGPAVQPLATVFTPLIFLLSVVGMRVAQPILVLGAPGRENLSLGSQAVMVFVIAWLVVRWIRVMSVAIEQQMARRGITDGLSILRMGRSAVTGVVWLLGVAAALQIFGLDLSTVIAGLGIGTAAIALASQQTLSNLFGGASVVADQVLNVGDTCKIDGNIATVERIGVRSTQLRTADRTVLVVANGDLAQSRIEKLSARDGFRHVATIGVRYETPPETMLAIVADLEKRLREDPLVEPSSAMAHFIGFGDSSLNIEMRAMFRTLDMPTYRAAIQRINVDCMRIVARHGSGFAFPSRTIYMAQDTGVGSR